MSETSQLNRECNLQDILAAERTRLVRLCARLSGNKEAAEDLAQEVLLTAWRHSDRLREADQYGPWLSSIARNVCLNWSRGHYREQAHLAQQATHESSGNLVDMAPDEFDIEVELERQELALMLDRAMVLLPPETRVALVEHFIEESSHAEIAAKLGVSEGAVALRLHRGKLALRRILTSDLSEELATYRPGAGNNGWVDTRIWCPACGEHRMQGWFRKDDQSGKFMLRCPACDIEPGSFNTGADLSVPFYAATIGDVKAYKPAFSRLINAIGNQYQQALATDNAVCIICGRSCTLKRGRCANNFDTSRNEYKVSLYCIPCGWASNNSLLGVAMSLPKAQQWWRDHPRLRSLPTREIEVAGMDAIVQSVQSVREGAVLDAVILRHNFKVIQIHTTSGP